MPEKNQSCENCYFFYATNNNGVSSIGWCRANPPHPHYTQPDPKKHLINAFIAIYPTVKGDMWCGAWDGKN